MSKGGIGVGSASIVLVFAVLCLTIFSLISLSAATGDKALVDAEAEMVQAYYRADTQAEIILDAILRMAPLIPAQHDGVAIASKWQDDGSYAIIEYACTVTQRKELGVVLKLHRDGSCDIQRWSMQDYVEWTYDPSLPIWQGESFWTGP